MAKKATAPATPDAAAPSTTPAPTPAVTTTPVAPSAPANNIVFTVPRDGQVSQQLIDKAITAISMAQPITFRSQTDAGLWYLTTRVFSDKISASAGIVFELTSDGAFTELREIESNPMKIGKMLMATAFGSSKKTWVNIYLRNCQSAALDFAHQLVAFGGMFGCEVLFFVDTTSRGDTALCAFIDERPEDSDDAFAEQWDALASCPRSFDRNIAEQQGLIPVRESRGDHRTGPGSNHSSSTTAPAPADTADAFA